MVARGGRVQQIAGVGQGGPQAQSRSGSADLRGRSSMNSVLSESLLFYTYLIYTLSFFVMSYLVLLGIRKATAISLISTFYLLAFFGITHGFAELIDLARLVLRVAGHGEGVILKY